MGTNEMLQLVS
jgi:aryl-alcohol dehydrogenase-like predicted oxidoreductase